jgi:hypothetical protein
MTNVKPIRHIHHIWLDEMEIYATFLHEEIFAWVDFDNSNQVFFLEYGCVKVENPRYEYQILFSQNNINLFSYFKWTREKWEIETKDYVVFYGSCFRIHGKDFVLDTLLSLFRLSDTHVFRRFDICADFLLPISTILSKFKEIEQKGAHFYGSKWEIETEYIWDKKNSKNRRSIIRIYNKKADILAKWKNKLYQDYLLEDYVTRVELEVRRELAQNYTLEELFVDDNLVWLLKNYLRKHTQIFEEYDIDKISLYRKPKTVDFAMIQAHGESLMRVRMFLGHARGLLARGLCPVYALLSKDIMDPKTHSVLTRSWNFVQIMRDIKIQAENWKDIMDAIKDKTHDSDKWV